MVEQSCIFCRIVHKEIPASVVYEDEKVMVFMDLKPVSEGHALVIPKVHYENIYDIPEDLIGYVQRIVKRTAMAAKTALQADGISIAQQNESAAGQEIFHIHVHLIPRYKGRAVGRFGETPIRPRQELDQLAERIKHSFQD
jgi:histidine triad (HIT) family protein